VTIGPVGNVRRVEMDPVDVVRNGLTSQLPAWFGDVPFGSPKGTSRDLANRSCFEIWNKFRFGKWDILDTFV